MKKNKLNKLTREELLSLLLDMMEDQENSSQQGEPSVRTELPDAGRLKAELKKLRYRKRYLQVLISTVCVLIVAAAVSVLTATMFVPAIKIYGSSMTPVLENGEIVLAVKNSGFQQGDIVAFYYGNKMLIKRYIAGPGDWVNIDEEGTVLVNGEILEEPYLEEKALGLCDLTFPYQVPDGKYFVMGDKRADSIDSRSSEVGCIAKEEIVGKVYFRVWPLSKIGAVK